MTSSPSYFARGPHFPPTHINPTVGYGSAQASGGVGQPATPHDGPGLVAPSHRFIPPAQTYSSYHQPPPSGHRHGFDAADPSMADAEFARVRARPLLLLVWFSRLSQTQKVQVRIRADVWVVGMVVGVLQFCKWVRIYLFRLQLSASLLDATSFDQISGRGYELEVEYVAPDTGRPTTGRFPPSDVRRA
ncbi:hypothetical protein EVG20_g3829 [Dentipellis fragilis]|uniref:Uncharacterized protein n=1 Tax=Dentipellis fragilis TaxID=205917 RepID=A0A4Y9YZG3_9AGAM|nr:hypothetical protein EVG20_g3829 [Dentipellis fragilis]